MLRLAWKLYGMAPRPLRRSTAIVAGWAGHLVGTFKDTVTIPAFDLTVDFSDNAAFRYWRWGRNYERELVASFLRIISLNPASIVVDVGASYGFLTLSAAAIGRHGLVRKILSYEPDRRSHGALTRSIQRNGLDNLISLTRTLVGDSDGTAKLFQSGQASTSNRSFGTETGHFTYTRVEELPVTRLDSDIAANGIAIAENRFVLKVDVEGNEFRVFRGAQEMLGRSRGTAVLFEFFPVGLKEVGASVVELRETLGGISWQTLKLRDNGPWRHFDSSEAFFAELEHLFAANNDVPAYAADCVLAREMVAD